MFGKKTNNIHLQYTSPSFSVRIVESNFLLHSRQVKHRLWYTCKPEVKQKAKILKIIAFVGIIWIALAMISFVHQLWKSGEMPWGLRQRFGRVRTTVMIQTCIAYRCGDTYPRKLWRTNYCDGDGKDEVKLGKMCKNTSWYVWRRCFKRGNTDVKTVIMTNSIMKLFNLLYSLNECKKYTGWNVRLQTT